MSIGPLLFYLLLTLTLVVCALVVVTAVRAHSGGSSWSDAIIAAQERWLPGHVFVAMLAFAVGMLAASRLHDRAFPAFGDLVVLGMLVSVPTAALAGLARRRDLNVPGVLLSLLLPAALGYLIALL